jgi:PAS domain S-box-containing protein
MKPSVLIVDDSLTVRMDLGQAFDEANYEAMLCASLQEARAALAQGTFALAVLDVLLPDGDGVEFLKELRSAPATSDLPVLLLSTEDEVRDRVRGLTMGGDGYVGKPYDTGMLLTRAREVIRRKTRTGTARAKRTVLIIDDSPTSCEAMKSRLEGAGYTVLTAPKGEDGLRIAAEARPDALIIDGVMPGMDGPSVIRQLRMDAVFRRTPCLLVTGTLDRTEEARALDAGADAFIRKDEDLDVILARLAAILRATRGSSATMGMASLSAPKRILAVDDSMTYLNELSDHLRGEGYEVVQARSGEQALELLAQQAIDCILLDLMMPGLSGKETCSRIKNVPDWREIPLMMITALEEGDAMIEGINAGADDYIKKSSDFEVLKARLRAQIRRKQFEDENRQIREQLLSKELEAAEARSAREVAEIRAALLSQLENKNDELAKANEVLRESEGRFRSIADNSPVMIWISDEAGQVIYLNKPWLDFRGRSMEEELGDGWTEGLHPEDRDRCLLTYRTSLGSRTAFKMEYRMQRSDGEFRWVLDHGVPRTGPDGSFSGFIGTCVDITERRAIEQMKNEFISVVSHELRTPLTSIRGSLGLIAGGATGVLPEKAKSMIDVAVRSTDRLVRLINDILDIEKIESGKMKFVLKPLEIESVVEQAIESTRAYGERLGIPFVLGSRLPGARIYADLDRLIQVLANLLSNAAKYSPSQGSVTVSLSRRSGMIRVAVTDTGPGIPEEFQGRIFQKFSQADSSDTRQKGGTGLGLNISKAIIEKHGGTIGFTTQKGAGTTFYFELPELPPGRSGGSGVFPRMPFSP